MRSVPRIIQALALCVAAALIIVLASSGAPAGPKKLSWFDPQAKELTRQMTLDEKIGQMVQVDLSALKDIADIDTYHLGSLLSGGDSDPKEGNSLMAWTDMFDRNVQVSTKTRLGIPVLYGVDALHGHNNVIGAVVFPHNIGLGCTRNPKLVEKIAQITAKEIRATGIQWTFAPCVTVPQDLRWGRTYEGFSEDPALVAQLGEAAVRGLQGADLANPLSVLACAKHYVGDGGTALGSGIAKMLDQGDTRVDEATLRRTHLPGYVSAIRAGVGTIMPSYNSWNGVKCSASKRLMTEILKEELGFEGFLISDYNAIEQLDRNFKKAIGISINAGMDMAMVTNRYREFYTLLKELVQEEIVPMARIDDAVTRILRVKFAMGLMDRNRPQTADRKLHLQFGSREHRAVARQAVRESLVLLKNAKKTLPLSAKAARIHVAGKSADDIGNQVGGWTITWQGKSGQTTMGGTTILAAIRAAASKTEVTYSKDGAGAEGAKVGVVVIGETPYAEMRGDRADLALAPEDLTALKNMKKAGIPVAVVLISGRPLILGEALDLADALVAAWLPGTEGAGVADVLFGAYKPTGKLSFAWPKAMDQVGKPVSDPVFPLSYGLKY